MAVTALAIPAIRMLPVAQLDVMKVAPGAANDAVRQPEADIDGGSEPFHSLMQELSAREEQRAIHSPKGDDANANMKDVSEAPPGKTESSHWQRQGTAGEKSKGKTAKKDVSQDIASSVPMAAPLKETKPPMVWSLPQMPVAAEPLRPQAPTSQNGARGTGEENQQQQKVATMPGVQALVQGAPSALPQDLPQEHVPDGGITGSTADGASEVTAQVGAIELDDSLSADPVTNAAPTAPAGDVTSAALAFEARLRPIQTDRANEQAIAPEPRSDHAETVSMGASGASLHAVLSVAESPQEIQPGAQADAMLQLPSPDLASHLGPAITAKAGFEARSQPILPAQTITPGMESQIRVANPQPSPYQKPAQKPSDTPHPEAVAASTEKRSDNQRDQQGRQPKTAASLAAPSTADAVGHVETAISSATSSMAPSMMAPAPVVSSLPASASASTPAASDLPAARAGNAPTDPAPTTAAANDIKIALNDNGQRVELRVTERSGDIHVTVRTPDSQLATAMREDLPALSSRLEQSGLHSEMWRPAAGSGENKMIETSGGNAASDSREEGGGKQQQRGQQQDPRNPQQTLNRKSDRKEFSWLFESIR